ncbi:MAG: DUF5126 domain-containing protein [Parabacteroides sp.]|nr:DUF5126 domain-containing protein [Parabacteroides sp.]
MKKIVILIFGCLCGLFMGCDDKNIDWQPGTDSIAPDTISIINVENLPGAAKITYNLPNDKDLVLVEAVYTIDGKKQRTSASVYTNSLTVYGFGSTDAQTIQLYSVDRSGNYSQGVNVVINPLTPPVISIFESIKMGPSFGGVSLQWDNPSESNVSLWLLVKDSTGIHKEVETIYTSASSGQFKLRGFEAKKELFGVYVRDRWNNLSDTLFAELTPLYEEKIDSKFFKRLSLPRDEDDAGQFSRMFDGNIAVGMYTSVAVSLSPVFFTIDLGQPVMLSRYILWHRQSNPYNNCSPKLWKVYGTLNPDFSNSDTNYWVNGYQKDWELLSDVNNISQYKPSGDDLQNTSEDLAAALAGFDIECTNETPVRYLRFEITENWAMPVRTVIGELEFYGAPQE